MGNLVGFLFALLAFSLTVVSFPLLLDRNVGVVAAAFSAGRNEESGLLSKYPPRAEPGQRGNCGDTVWLLASLLTVKHVAGRETVDKLDAPNLDHTVPVQRVESGRLGIDDDFTHGMTLATGTSYDSAQAPASICGGPY